jgi:hypothetical protein
MKSAARFVFSQNKKRRAAYRACCRVKVGVDLLALIVLTCAFAKVKTVKASKAQGCA